MIMIMSVMAAGWGEVRAPPMTRSYSRSANLNYFCLITLTFCPRPWQANFLVLVLVLIILSGIVSTLKRPGSCSGSAASFKINNVYLLFLTVKKQEGKSEKNCREGNFTQLTKELAIYLLPSCHKTNKGHMLLGALASRLFVPDLRHSVKKFQENTCVFCKLI